MVWDCCSSCAALAASHVISIALRTLPHPWPLSSSSWGPSTGRGMTSRVPGRPDHVAGPAATTVPTGRSPNHHVGVVVGTESTDNQGSARTRKDPGRVPSRKYFRPTRRLLECEWVPSRSVPRDERRPGPAEGTAAGLPQEGRRPASASNARTALTGVFSLRTRPNLIR
jgi:hypothetical protein